MKLPEVVSMGTLLVEIMQVKRDEPLNQSGTFAGPFPSGDIPIYMDAVARLDRPAGFIGAVGQDDFGRCLRNRFTRDGVDSSCGQILSDYTTGAAFVTYFSDGSRKFIYPCRHTAGQLNPTYVKAEYFKEAKWLNLTGAASDEAGGLSGSNFWGVRHAHVPNGAARGCAGSSNLDLLSLVGWLEFKRSGAFCQRRWGAGGDLAGPMEGMPTRQESLDLIKG